MQRAKRHYCFSLKLHNSQSTFFHMALQSLQGSKLITMRYKSRAFRFFDFFCFLSVYVFFLTFFLRSFDRFGIFVGRNFNNLRSQQLFFFAIFLVYHVSMCLLLRKSYLSLFPQGKIREMRETLSPGSLLKNQNTNLFVTSKNETTNYPNHQFTNLKC